jgi:hypothetical protein
MKGKIFFVLLFMATLSVHSQNLVVNPGFESWDSDTKPTGWTTAQNCLSESSIVWSGSHSCRQAGTTSSKYLGQMIQVTSGNTYCLSFYYQTQITDNGNGCRIWCYWKDSEGASLADPSTDDLLRPSQYLKSDDWSQFSVNVTAPEGAVALYMEVRTYPNSVTYWDEFSFSESVATYSTGTREQDIVIYPNPASDNLYVKGSDKIESVEIYNMEGIPIWSRNYDGQPLITVPVSNLREGFYTVIIRLPGRTVYRKLLKEASF